MQVKDQVMASALYHHLETSSRLAELYHLQRFDDKTKGIFETMDKCHGSPEKRIMLPMELYIRTVFLVSQSRRSDAEKLVDLHVKKLRKLKDRDAKKDFYRMAPRIFELAQALVRAINVTTNPEKLEQYSTELLHLVKRDAQALQGVRDSQFHFAHGAQAFHALQGIPSINEHANNMAAIHALANNGHTKTMPRGAVEVETIVLSQERHDQLLIAFKEFLATAKRDLWALRCAGAEDLVRQYYGKDFECNCENSCALKDTVKELQNILENLPIILH